MNPNKAFKLKKSGWISRPGHERYAAGSKRCAVCGLVQSIHLARCGCGNNTEWKSMAPYVPPANNIFKCDRCGWKQIVNKDLYFNCKCTHCGYEGNGFTVMKQGGDKYE